MHSSAPVSIRPYVPILFLVWGLIMFNARYGRKCFLKDTKGQLSIGISKFGLYLLLEHKILQAYLFLSFLLHRSSPWAIISLSVKVLVATY